MENSDLTSSTYALLIQLMMQSKHQLQAVAERRGLNAIQAQALMMLKGDGIAMSSIGKTLGCDASNVTGIVDRLEAVGMIERRADPLDRRIKRVALSEAGAIARQELMLEITNAEVKRIGPALSPAEIHILNGLLQKLIDRSREVSN